MDDKTVKILLVIFICLVAFSAGTYVGQTVSDSDHKRMQFEKEMNNTHETVYGP